MFCARTNMHILSIFISEFYYLLVVFKDSASEFSGLSKHLFTRSLWSHESRSSWPSQVYLGVLCGGSRLRSCMVRMQTSPRPGDTVPMGPTQRAGRAAVGRKLPFLSPCLFMGLLEWSYGGRLPLKQVTETNKSEAAEACFRSHPTPCLPYS